MGGFHFEKPQLFTTQSRLLKTRSKTSLENIEGKRENAGNQHFLLFPQCFQPYQRRNSSFIISPSSANAFNLDQSKILSFGTELNLSPN